MLHPVVRRTWAPRGQTPVLACWDRHERLSVISALTCSSRRRRLGLYFDIVDHNIVADDFVEFVARLLRRIRRRILLVLDRWQVHRAGVRRLERRFGDRVRVEWLPPYTPELNPTEQVWSHTKYADLANFVPNNVFHLGRSIAESLRKTQSRKPLLYSFFQHAKLQL